MSNSVGYTPGEGALIAVENIAGVLHQRVKIGVGVTGTAVDVSTANPMPITAPSAIPISTPSAIDVTVGNFPATQNVNIVGGSSGNAAAGATGAAVPASADYIGINVGGNLQGVSATNPMPSGIIDPSTAVSFGPITTANTVLFTAVDTANKQSIQLQIAGLWTGGIAFQGSDDGTTYFSVQYVNFSDQQSNDTLYAPDTVVVPVTTKFFRAITTRDFVGSASGVYSLRFAVAPTPFVQSTMVGIDPQVVMPMGGETPNGYVRRIKVADNGGVIPADGTVITGTRLGTQVGPIVQLETTGYGTVVLQLAGTFTGTVTFQVSNDGSTWVSAVAWSAAGAAVPVTTATAVGQWLIPASGRFFRAQITTAGTGQPLAVAVLKNFSFAFPTSTPSQNMAQISGTAAVTAGVAGMLAVGGNIAEDTAATSNPLICGGVARTALPASTVVAGDAIRQTFSVSGQLVTKENAPADLDFYANVTVTTSAQTAIRAAQASPIRQNVTGLTFQNTNATATTLTIQDGSTTLITFSVPASMTLPVQLDFPTPLRGTAATALNYTAGTTGANILLNVIGFNSY